MSKVSFPIRLMIFTFLFNGCSTHLLHTRPFNDQIASNPHFVVIENQAGELYFNIPPTGLSLSNAVRKIGFEQPRTNPLPATASTTSNEAQSLGELESSIRDFISPSLHPEDPEYNAIKERGRNDAIKSLTTNFRQKSGIEINEADANEIIDEIKEKYEENPVISKIEDQIALIFNSIKVAKSIVLFEPPPSDKAASSQTDFSVQQLIRVVRQSGDEIVVSSYHVLNSDIGAILLANGDRVSIERESLLTPEKMLDGYVNVFDQDTSTVIATPSVTASPQIKKLDCQKIDDVKCFWEKKVMPNNSPYDTVVSVRRALPNGRERIFIVPLPLDDRSTDTVIRKKIMEMHKLAPGDTVHVGTLELLPIVLGSKIISKRLQLAALKEEYELEQTEAHEKHQRLKAFRQKMQSKREGNALVAPQEWVRSASNRIADGFDSMRDAVGLP